MLTDQTKSLQSYRFQTAWGTRFYKVWNADFKIGMGTFYHTWFVNQVDSKESKTHFQKKVLSYFWKYRMFFKWVKIFVYVPYGSHMGPIWVVCKSYNGELRVYRSIKNVSHHWIGIGRIFSTHLMNLMRIEIIFWRCRPI